MIKGEQRINRAEDSRGLNGYEDCVEEFASDYILIWWARGVIKWRVA